MLRLEVRWSAFLGKCVSPWPSQSGDKLSPGSIHAYCADRPLPGLVSRERDGLVGEQLYISLGILVYSRYYSKVPEACSSQGLEIYLT